jgi:hypothetical protein
LWTQLTDAEIKGWYSATDLCVLRSEDRTAYPQVVKAEHCAAVSNSERKLQCGVGMSGQKGAPCFPPFVSRPSFFKGVAGYTDPLRKPLLEALWYFHKSNTTVVFLGDSVMRQKLAAFECEVLREFPSSDMGVKLQAVGQTSCHQKLSLRIPKSAFMFLEPYNTTVGGQPKRRRRRRRLAGKKVGGGHKKQQQRREEGRGSYEDAHSVFIEVHGLVLGKRGESCIRGGGPLSERAIGRGESVLKVAQEEVKKIAQNNPKRRLFVLANLGGLYGEERVHGEDRVENHRRMFNDDMNRIFTWLGSFVDAEPSRGHFVAWQETASQHWHSPPVPTKAAVALDGSATTLTGYYSRAAEQAAMLRWFNTSPTSTTNVDTLPLAQWQVPSCCAEFRSVVLARQIRRSPAGAAREALVKVWQQVVEEEEAADWRNRAVHDRVKTFNVGRAAGGRAGDKGRAMEVLPLAKYTKEAADLHTCHQVHQHDCTHLCFTPLLWQPLWHDLIRLAKTMPL